MQSLLDDPVQPGHDTATSASGGGDGGLPQVA